MSEFRIPFHPPGMCVENSGDLETYIMIVMVMVMVMVANQNGHSKSAIK